MIKMPKALDFTEFETQNKNPVTQKLISLLSKTRSIISAERNPTKYAIKKRLMGKSEYSHCHTKALLIKEVVFNLFDENDEESLLCCSYYFCTKCGSYLYNDGHEMRLSFF